jgi:hypothetical protein
LGIFNHWSSFYMFLALAFHCGCDPSHDYFSRKTYQAQWGLQKVYFSLVRGLSKMVFPHFKPMHLWSVSHAIFHANMQNAFSLFI